MSRNVPVYEIINFSDKYTISHPNRAACCMAVALMGGGEYALEEIGPPPGERFEMPLFPGSGSEEWFTQQFGLGLVDCLIANIDDVIEALDSVIIGDRELYEIAVEDMTPEQEEKFRKKWHDRHRSSMNDIGAYASIVKNRLVKRKDTLKEESDGSDSES